MECAFRVQMDFVHLETCFDGAMTGGYELDVAQKESVYRTIRSHAVPDALHMFQLSRTHCEGEVLNEVVYWSRCQCRWTYLLENVTALVARLGRRTSSKSEHRHTILHQTASLEF